MASYYENIRRFPLHRKISNFLTKIFSNLSEKNYPNYRNIKKQAVF